MVMEIQIPVLPQVDGCITIRISAKSHIYGDYEEIEVCTTVTKHITYQSTSISWWILLCWPLSLVTSLLSVICLQYDGVTNFLHTPYFIDLISSGSQVLPDLEIPVPERFIRPQERQHLFVPGSQRATIGIVGRSDTHIDNVGVIIL